MKKSFTLTFMLATLAIGAISNPASATTNRQVLKACKQPNCRVVHVDSIGVTVEVTNGDGTKTGIYCPPAGNNDPCSSLPGPVVRKARRHLGNANLDASGEGGRPRSGAQTETPGGPPGGPLQ